MANQIKYFGSTDLYNLLVLLKGEYDKYVLAVQGKGLSTNDFTDALLSKLNGIATGAEVNVQSDYSQTDNTADDYIKNKPTLGTAAAKDVPASGNASATQVVMGSDSRLTDARPASNVTDTYSATSHAPVSGVAVAQALATITGIRFESYPSFADLPAVGENGVIYLIPNGGSAPNVKDEYFWNSATSAYEKFGTTDVDLTDYLKDTDVVEMTQAEVQTVWNSVFGSGS
jgi:hypothetical protein